MSQAKTALPKEFQRGAFSNVDWTFTVIYSVVTIIYTVIILLASRIPIPEPTEDDIKRLQDQFAKFVLKEDPVEEEPVDEGPAEEASTQQTVQEQKAQERVQERSKSSAKEKAEARQARAAERAAAREKAAAAVANVGALAMLTAVGDGGDDDGDDQVEDMLGSGGVQSANLGKALSSMDGLKSGGAGAATGRGRRGRRGGKGAAGGGGVDDLLSGIGTAGSRSLSRKGSISLSRPDKVVGKAAKSANRSIEAVNGVIKQKQGAIQFCFKKELRKNPNLSGKITVRFTIAATGRVSKASVARSSVGSKSLEQCLLKTIRRLKFKPIAASEGSMTVTYPFVFSAG